MDSLSYGGVQRGLTSGISTAGRAFFETLNPYLCLVNPMTTTVYDRGRANFDRHATYVVVAFVADADR
jgi:hypothetical protein